MMHAEFYNIRSSPESFRHDSPSALYTTENKQLRRAALVTTPLIFNGIHCHLKEIDFSKLKVNIFSFVFMIIFEYFITLNTYYATKVKTSYS